MSPPYEAKHKYHRQVLTISVWIELSALPRLTSYILAYTKVGSTWPGNLWIASCGGDIFATSTWLSKEPLLKSAHHSFDKDPLSACQLIGKKRIFRTCSNPRNNNFCTSTNHFTHFQLVVLLWNVNCNTGNSNEYEHCAKNSMKSSTPICQYCEILDVFQILLLRVLHFPSSPLLKGIHDVIVHIIQL